MPGAVFSLSIGILMAEAFKQISLNASEQIIKKFCGMTPLQYRKSKK
jgi:hypothetical protein